MPDRARPAGKSRAPGRYARAVSFYDEVMRELIAAIGAALLVANLIALARRHKDADVRGRPIGCPQRQGEGQLAGAGHGPHPRR